MVTNHPFRFLLRFEWCLLALCAVGEVVRVPPFRLLRGMPHAPLWNLTIVLIFVLLSFRSPGNGKIQRLAYGALLLGLLSIAAFSTGLQLLPLLCIVVVLRCGVMFGPLLSWTLTGLTFLIGAGSQVYYLMTFRLPRLEQMALRRSARLGLSPGEINPDGLDPVTSRLWTSSLSSILLLGLVLLFVQVLIASLVAERRNRDALTIANQRLRDYAEKAEAAATLQERNRISREIHDALGHSLTASNIHLEAALRLLKSDPEEATDLLQEAKRLGSETLQAVRDSVSALRSEDPLKSQPLDKAIELLLQDWSRSSQIVPSFDVLLDVSNFPESLKIAIYRIIQEALTNISKYAQASEVWICLTATSNSGLTLMIRDDGVGFVRSQTRSGFGLQGIEERVQALDGTVEIVSECDRGCTIRVLFSPLPLLPIDQCH